MEKEQIPKFHKRMYTGKTEENASGYEYVWDSTHNDLEETQTFYPDEYKSNAYCVYCGSKSYPIQAGLRNQDRCSSDYLVTGYTCVCEGAESEIEYRKFMKNLKDKHTMEIKELRNQYKNRLVHDNKKIIDITMKYKKRKLECDLRYQSVDFLRIE